jgi:Uma2 family endonuclease
MVQAQPLASLLTEDDLPYTDDQPVDNELQVLLPNLLRAILAWLWVDPMDWFLGVNMGIYVDPPAPAIGPDAFLSLGVPRYKREQGRLSYVVPQENYVVPQWVLEIVSQKPGGEYGDKFQQYVAMGVLYYVIYNPNHWKRDKHQPFEVYRLEKGSYIRQLGNPVWMPEVGLGIGLEQGTHEGFRREWLYWYDEAGKRYPAPENVIQQERQARIALEQELAQEQGLRSQAEQTAQQSLILRQLTCRFGSLPDPVINQINCLALN